TLEESRKVEASISCRKTKPVDDLGVCREAKRDLVQVGDLPIAIHVVILDIPSPVFAVILTGRIGHLVIVHKKPLGDQTPLLAQRMANVPFVGFPVVALLVSSELARCICEIHTALQPELLGEDLVIIERKINPA